MNHKWSKEETHSYCEYVHDGLVMIVTTRTEFRCKRCNALLATEIDVRNYNMAGVRPSLISNYTGRVRWSRERGF